MKNQDFIERVHEIVKLIPEGRVTSYGAIAKYLATGMSSRMVGWAMKHSILSDVPAHRVLNRNGQLTGKLAFPTPTYMADKLRAEGVEVENDKVKNLKSHYWDPSLDL